MKNITLFAILVLTSTISLAQGQNACGTVIDFQNTPGPLCSSLQSTDVLYATPAGGTFSGAIVSINGSILNYGVAAGTYKVYYTAPDSCATIDSTEIEIVATQSEVYFSGAFDCTNDTPVNGVVLSTPNEYLSLKLDDDNFVFAENGDSDIFTHSAGAAVSATIITATGMCEMDVETPTTNVPSVSASVTYDCNLDRAFLDYQGPFTDRAILWRKYNDLGNALDPTTYIGAPYACTQAGDYLMRVIFNNGCETTRFLNVPAGVENVVPRVGSSVYSPLGCLNMPTDSFPLLASTSSVNVSYLWSSTDGSPFPGDPTVLRPLVPGVPGSYIFQATNLASGCVSNPDTSVIVRATGDTTAITADICEGEAYAINGQLFTVSGSYQSLEVGSNGCDSLILLDLTVNDLPAVSFTYTGPNAAGEYDVQATSTTGQAYLYSWCNGSIGAAVTGLPSLDCEVTITDANTGCSITENTNTAVVSSAQQAIPGSFTLAPNPVSDVVNWTYTGNATIVSSEVHSSTGQLIAKTSVNNALNQRLDLSTTPKGLYTITWIDAGGRMSTRRVIRQ